MSIQAVFFDIDGTLLTDQRSVSPSTIRAINDLKKQGILVGLATGRGPHFVLSYMAALGLDVAITYNGQYILSREKILYEQALPIRDVIRVLRYADKHQQDISFGVASGTIGSSLMTTGTSKWGYFVARLLPASWAGMINFILNRIVRKIKPQNQAHMRDLVKQQPIYQIMLLATELETALLRKTFPQLAFTRSSPYSADIITKGNSKLVGISKVGELYGFAPHQVMAFGDSNNDIEMLKGVGTGIAMGNATRKTKRAAVHVTASNNDNGIYKALQQFGLLTEEE